jgi:hypothetical protein
MTYRFDDDERKYEPGTAINEALSPEQRAEAEAGRLAVYDGFGHQVGLEGAVEDGGSYYTVVPGSYPPSVDKCLELLDEPYARDLLKYAVNNVLNKARESNRSVSGRLTSARVRRLIADRDVSLVFEYVSNGGYDWAVLDEGVSESVFTLLPPGPVVVAVREVLALSDGSSILSASAGRELREVGTTNRVKVSDYADAKEGAAAFLICRSAGFSISGFTAEPEASDITKIAADSGITSVAILDGFGLTSDDFRKNVSAAFDIIAVVNAPDTGGVSVVFAKKGAGFDIKTDVKKAGVYARALWENLRDKGN